MTTDRDGRGPRPAIGIGRFAGEALALAALYLLFAGALSVEEIVAASMGGLAAATLRVALVRSGRPFADGFRDAARIAPRVARSLLADSAKVGAAFAGLLVGRRPAGRSVEIPFDPGPPEPSSRTRRALVVAGVSLAPNQIVTGLRFEAGRLVVHQLAPVPPPTDERWPL